MTNPNNYNHWRLDKDRDNILWLFLDKKNASVNSLDDAIFDELSAILDYIQGDASLKGVVILSGKASGFIAGADIQQFTRLTTEAEGLALIRRGQILFQRIEDLSIPTVALIHGFCLGGGFELALACRYRIADEGEKTRIGLPEVQLGIQPGWGGTIRLPRLIGVPKAMDLILTGRVVNAREAANLGIVNCIVPERSIRRAAQYYILNKPLPQMVNPFLALLNTGFIRPWFGKILTQKVAKKVKREHYPAPYAVIDNWVKYGIEGEEAMLQEAKSIARLFMTPTAKNLIRVFYLQDELKGLAKGATSTPKHVHVIGAGTMGGDIAAWCALSGLTVTLQDREPQFIAPAIKRAHALFKKRFKKDSRRIQKAMDQLIPDINGFGIKRADVVIEAIIENLAAKQTLFQQIEPQLQPHAILATNTSSIPLDDLNKVLRHPERLVGIHFFNPVDKMRLVEVVHGQITDETFFKNALSFVKRIDRLPLPVKSTPGFLVNRILMPYLIESVLLVDEGIAPANIDKAAEDFGMPMGPIELADTVGLDICLSVAQILTQHYGGEVPEKLKSMVQSGKLGKKTGKGFYEFKNGKPIKGVFKDYTAEEQGIIQDRIIYRLLNESMACLNEKVVNNGNLEDAGMIFGTGFAPFRGGPIHYIETVGKDKIYQRLLELEKRFGPRFKPNFVEKEKSHAHEIA